ncbi:MAG TPA: ATP-dependent DNA ligase [Gemmatimonadaceae bacterium]
MRLRDLVESCETLETARARRRQVTLIADLLRRAGDDERAHIAYLLQARLRPPFEGVEVGLGDKLLAKAIADAYGASAATVARHYARSGDLGLVAQTLASDAPVGRLSVGDAYDRLLAIARTGGAGSIERKVRLFAALLGGAGGREAKFLVRVAQGRLRLGVGEQTILEAAAAGALGDGRRKPLLEHAYNVRSDLGDVVRIAFARGARGLTGLAPRIGVPVRPALAQRLPSAQAIIERLGTVQAEPKYDGFRIQIHRDGDRVWAFSRRLENVTGMFPELTEGVRRQLRARRAIIEGEAVVHDPRTGAFLPFQVTMTRKRKTAIAEAAARHPLRLYAFDLLREGARNWLPRPQRARSERLAELLPSRPNDPVAVTEAVLVHEASALDAYFDQMLRRGLEGVVAKRPDAPYRAGARGYDWVKLKRAYQSKLRDTVDLVLVGYQRGRGKRAALGIGSLLGAVYDPARDRFRTVAKIGSGLTDTQWKQLRVRLDRQATTEKPRRVDSLIEPDVWVTPAYVVEVLADEITRSPRHTCGREDGMPGYALRFPRIVNGVRADKAPADATTEREVLDLYRMQRRVAKGTRTPRPRASSPPR